VTGVQTCALPISMVVVALGEPGVPVVSCAATGAEISTATANADGNARRFLMM